MAGKVVDVTLKLVDKLSSPLNKIGKDLSKSAKQWERAGKQIQKAGKNISNVGKTLTTSITAPIVAMGSASVVAFGEVDKQLKLVESTMGEAKWATADLEDALKKAASNSVFTMQEASEATLNFARQGFDAKQAAEMLTPALDLAAGTATDLSEVTSGLGNTLKIFESQGLTASEASNIFAKAQAQANTTTTELFEAMSVGSSIFKTVGWSMQDLATVTDVFGDNFISGSEGATAMKTGLARLVSPTKDSSAWMEKLGINIINADGSMKSMVDVQSQLHEAFSGLTEQQKMQAASAMFGKNQMNKWLTLIDTAPETVQNYRNALDDATGTANDMATSLMSGVGGSIEKLKSTFDVFKYSIGELLSGPAKQLIDFVTNSIDKFNKMDESTQKMIVKIALIGASIGPAILIFGKLVTGIGGVISIIGKVGKAFRTFGTIAGIISSPAGIVIGIVSAIALSAFLIIKNWSKIKAFLGNLKKWFLETFGGTDGAISKFKDSFSRVADTISPIISSIVSWFKDMIPVAVEKLKKAFELIKPVIEKAVIIYINLVADNLDKMSKVFQKVVPIVINFIKNGIEKISPVMQKIFSAVKKVIPIIGSSLSKAFNIMLPVLKTAIKVVKQIVSVIGKNLAKCIKAILPVITSIQDCFAVVFEKAGEKFTAFVEFIRPIVEKIISVVLSIAEKLQPAISTAFEVIGNIIKGFSDVVTTIFTGIMGVLDGIITFITGVFSGNWEKAWEGVKKIFSSAFGTFAELAKTPINAVIGIINKAIEKLNGIKVDIPDWVPGMGGSTFGLSIPTIPKLAVGTDNWKGGLVQISERGGEIVDLPGGSRVYPHDESVSKAFSDGKNSNNSKTININIPKLADSIVVREDADIDRIAQKLADKLEKVCGNIGGGDIGYSY